MVENQGSEYLTVTNIGKLLGLDTKTLWLALESAGLAEKGQHGWQPTDMALAVTETYYNGLEYEYRWNYDYILSLLSTVH